MEHVVLKRVAHARNRLPSMHAIPGEVYFASPAINTVFGDADRPLGTQGRGAGVGRGLGFGRPLSAVDRVVRNTPPPAVPT